LPSHQNFLRFNGIALWQCHYHFQLSNAQKTNCGISFLPVTVRTETGNKVAGEGGNQIEEVHLEKANRNSIVRH